MFGDVGSMRFLQPMRDEMEVSEINRRMSSCVEEGIRTYERLGKLHNRLFNKSCSLLNIILVIGTRMMSAAYVSPMRE
jgi:hypothetical protein